MGRTFVHKVVPAGVSLCDLETSRMRWPGPTLGCCTRGGKQNGTDDVYNFWYNVKTGEGMGF
jgi:hypothetical protein